METRLKRLKDKDDSKAIRKQTKDLDDLMKRLDEMQKAIKELEAVHKDEVKEVRSKVASEISVEEKTLKEKQSQSQQ